MSSVDEEDRRRMHAETESRRAKRINDGIMHLRDLMVASQFPSPKDKAGILQAAAMYIQHLEERLRSKPEPKPTAKAARASTTLMWPPGIDYRLVFLQSSLPQVISHLDGRFVECSDLFLKVTGYSREEILDGGIFTLTPAEDLQETYAVISDMMKEAETVSSACKAEDNLTPTTVSSHPEAGSPMTASDEEAKQPAAKRRTGSTSAAGTRIRKHVAENDSLGTASSLSSGSKRSYKMISNEERAKAAQVIVHNYANPSTCALPVTRAFNKICKMKCGRALVHVRMSMIMDESMHDPRYILCTILPLASSSGEPPQYSMLLTDDSGKHRTSTDAKLKSTSAVSISEDVGTNGHKDVGTSVSSRATASISAPEDTTVKATMPGFDSAPHVESLMSPLQCALSITGNDAVASDLLHNVFEESESNDHHQHHTSLSPVPFSVKFPFDAADHLPPFGLDDG